MTTAITAKVECQGHTPSFGESTNLVFTPDYADGRNAAWAAATPSLQFQMNVMNSVAALFELGGKYTVTFEPSDTPAAQA
jgi:hypothetical protein